MYIGVDIGGTNIRVGAVDKDGKIMHLLKQRVPAKSTEEFLQKLIEMIEQIPNSPKAAAIGIGVPGMVTGGEITTCRNLKILVGFPLAKRLEEYFKKPVRIENDAKVAALGEAVAGAGGNSKIMAYVGLGTGLGGGVIINKQIYSGASNLGGYFSRIVLDGKEIAENLVAGMGLSAQICKALSLTNKDIQTIDFGTDKNGSPKSILSKGMPLSDFFALAKTDPAAHGILHRFCHNLTNLLLNISVTINPDTIVLGGGIMDSAAHFLPQVLTAFRTHAHNCALSTQIIPAALNQPGVIGAALFARNATSR